MKEVLINRFRNLNQCILNWKSKQKTSDWLAYLFFWIGTIGTLYFILLSASAIPWYAIIVLSIGTGAIAETFYMIPYVFFSCRKERL